MNKTGFTVLEMTIVMALLVILAGVIILSSTRFVGQSSLQTQAEEIAASIKKCQIQSNEIAN